MAKGAVHGIHQGLAELVWLGAGAEEVPEGGWDSGGIIGPGGEIDGGEDGQKGSGPGGAGAESSTGVHGKPPGAV
jgi:hypothetical protein